MWAKGTPREADMKVGPFPALDTDVTESTFRDACLAVNLGRQWLEAPHDPGAAAVREMAISLDALRATARVRSGKAPVAFRKAVVWTWIVSLVQKRRAHASRLVVQKVTYLLEYEMNLGLFSEHERKPLGPYDRKARYRDAEPIAVKKGWLKVRGTTLRACEDLTEVNRFVGRYVRSEALARQVIEYFVRFPDDELEALATVHWTARELAQAGLPVSVAAVTEALGNTPEWRAKLRRPAFSSERLGTVLLRLQELLLAPKA